MYVMYKSGYDLDIVGTFGSWKTVTLKKHFNMFYLQDATSFLYQMPNGSVYL